MKITKNCVYTNRKNTMEVDITDDQYKQLREGANIDQLLPEITYEEREFLLTGALPGEIDEINDLY